MERHNYLEINSEAVASLSSANKHITSIDQKLRALIELRVSQINGCSYCIDLHCRQARETGETQQRLDCLQVWNECDFYTDAEKAVFAWTEAVTKISETHAPDHFYLALSEHFNAREVVDISLIIALMNTWNRLAISLHQPRLVRKST